MTSTHSIPLISRDLKSLIAYHESFEKDCQQFLNDVISVGESLPDQPHACLVCKNQYWFMVGFFAAISRGQINLLPPNHRQGTLSKVLERFPDSYLLHDGKLTDDFGSDAVNVRELPRQQQATMVPNIDSNAIVVIVFTSGTTGESTELPKTWGTLVTGALINSAVLAENVEFPLRCVSTVPAGHMYGLEWSVMVPTVCDVAVYAGSPFFPADTSSALATSLGTRWLITTPLQLKALTQSGLYLPPAALVLSATSPLDKQLAMETELQLHGKILEIYGCSEVGSMAQRYPTQNERWKFLSPYKVRSKEDTTFISADHLPTEFALGDMLRLQPGKTFDIIGRKHDLIKIGGKRESLLNLTQKILNVDGIEDAVVFVRPTDDNDSTAIRLAAFVVSDGVDLSQLRQYLAQSIEPVFMPRPLRVVQKLPREPTGKLPRERLIALLKESEPNQRS